MPVYLKAELLKFQLPFFEQARKDKKPFREAVGIAKSVPWPKGLKSSSLCAVITTEPAEEEERARDVLAREDKEGEKLKRAERARQAAEDTAREKAERLRRKALKTYNPETDALRVKTFCLDSVANMDRPEITFEGTSLQFASRLFERTDIVNSEGERIPIKDEGGNVLYTKVSDLSHADDKGRPFTPVRLDISDEVRQALRLSLAQRKAFGAAKDRGSSDADALAFAKNAPPE